MGEASGACIQVKPEMESRWEHSGLEEGKGGTCLMPTGVLFGVVKTWN